MKILKSDLDNALSVLRKATSIKSEYGYDKAYGGYKLVSKGGAREISPRLSKRAMYDWMWAYIEGIKVGKSIDSIRT